VHRHRRPHFGFDVVDDGPTQPVAFRARTQDKMSKLPARGRRGVRTSRGDGRREFAAGVRALRQGATLILEVSWWCITQQTAKICRCGFYAPKAGSTGLEHAAQHNNETKRLFDTKLGRFPRHESARRRMRGVC
jgi:hypothetical protein